MKCEKCNEKEATFYYSSNINGEKSQRHLCHDCARQEGFGGALDYSPQIMIDRVFEDLFEDFFAPVGRGLPSFANFGLPFGGIMAPALPRRRVRTQPEPDQPQTAAEAAIPEDAGEEIRQRRECEALRAKLYEAVKAEDYEQAIILRDKLREMEK